MLTFIESRRKTIVLAGATLTALLFVAIAWTVAREHTFTGFPVYGFTVLLSPVLLACLSGLLRPARTGRFLLLSAALLFAAWVVGFAGLVAAALVLLAALTVGAWLGRYGGIGREQVALPDALLAITLGLAVMGIALTILAHRELNSPPIYATGLLTIALLGWRSSVRYFQALRDWLVEESKPGFGIWLAAGLFTGVALLNVSYSSLVGFSADTVALHLYVPSYMSAYGEWSYDVQKYIWGVQPMAADFLFGVAYMLSDATGAQFLNVLVSLLVAGLIYTVCRSRAGTLNALLAATAWLAMPYLLQIAQSLFVEGLLSLFLFAAFVYLDDKRMTDSKPWQVGMVAGILAGAAVATKLTGWIFTPVYLLLVFGVLGRRHGWKWATRVAVTAALIMLVFGGYQYWYALTVTGNPVFFFYNSIFLSPFFDSTNFLDRHWVGRYDWHLPFALTFHTERFAESGPGTMGFQWLMFLPAALLFMLFKDGSKARWFGSAGLFFAMVVLLPEQYLRYILPAFPFLSVLLVEAGAQPGFTMQAVYRLGMFIAIGLNALGLQNAMSGFTDLPTKIVYHKESQDNAPVTVLNRIINALEPQPVNVLYVSRPGGAELHGTAYYTNWYSRPMYRAFSGIHSPDDVSAIVAADDIRYVILEPPYLYTRKASEVATYSEQHGQLIAKIGDFYLYRLDLGAPYLHDAVVNPQLADDAKGWSFRGATPKYMPGAGYVLDKSVSIYQKLDAPTFAPYQPFYFGATVTCLKEQGSVRAQILWKIGNEAFTPSAATYWCTHKGVMNISEVFYAPKGTWKGVASFNVDDARAQVAVAAISIRY